MHTETQARTLGTYLVTVKHPVQQRRDDHLHWIKHGDEERARTVVNPRH